MANPEKLTKDWVLDWVKDTAGWFSADQLDRDLQILTRTGKTNRRQILSRLVREGTVERKGGQHGQYRLVDGVVQEIAWQSADPNDIIPLEFAFDLHKYVKIFPKSIIVIAGVSNSGKTAWLYDFVLRNMERHEIDLFNSETSGEQMRERMDNFEIEIPNPPPFRTLERYENFADVVHPDKISVIDYLDLNSEVYLIGEEIERIHRKLKRGVAVIAIQKKPNQELGIGGMFSWKKASLYLSMDNNRLKIAKAKSWADPKINPNGKQWGFKLVGGAKFIISEIEDPWPGD